MALLMQSESGGCDGGGKGALVQKELSGTLGCNNDQTVFCLQGKGNERHAVCAGFKLGNSENARSIGYAKELAPTLNAECGGNKPAVLCMNGCRKVDISRTLDTTIPDPSKNQGGICILDMSHANDVIRECGDKAPCLQARMGTGGNQVPLCFGIGNGQVQEAMSIACEKDQTLNTMHDADAALQVAAVDCRNGTENPNINGTLQSKESGGVSPNTNNVCRVGKTVRRLTPTECARLQGFPDKWGHPIKKDSFSDEEYEFWHDVKNTHEAIAGKTPKKHKREQLLNWYNRLHTDSSEYKMWGNGIALPCALYCMEGIKESLMN